MRNPFLKTSVKIKKYKYKNIDEILDFVMNESDESDGDLLLEDDDNNSESDWKYEDGPDITFVADVDAETVENDPKTLENDPKTLENDQEKTVEETENDIPESISNARSDDEQAEVSDEAVSSDKDVPLVVNVASCGSTRARSRGVRVRGSHGYVHGHGLCTGCRGRGVRVHDGRHGVGTRGARGRPTSRGTGRGRGNIQHQQNPVGGQPAPIIWNAANEDHFVNLRNFPFQETEGVNVRMDGLTPKDFVNLYLTDEFWISLITD